MWFRLQKQLGLLSWSLNFCLSGCFLLQTGVQEGFCEREQQRTCAERSTSNNMASSLCGAPTWPAAIVKTPSKGHMSHERRAGKTVVTPNS